MVSFYERVGVKKQFDAQRKLVTSPIFSPTALARMRLIMGIYFVLSFVFSLAWDILVEKKGKRFFTYFTNLSFSGVTVYFCMSGLNTWFFARKEKQKSYPLQRWLRPVQFLYIWLQSTVITFPILVTAAFWGLLASPAAFADVQISWSNITFHAMNGGYALFEIFFSNSPPAPWLTLILNEVLIAFYVGLAYLTFATQGFYTYPFLNPDEYGRLVPAYIAGIAVGEAVVFILVRGIVVLREKISKGRTPTFENVTYLSLDLDDLDEGKKPMMREV